MAKSLIDCHNSAAASSMVDFNSLFKRKLILASLLVVDVIGLATNECDFFPEN